MSEKRGRGRPRRTDADAEILAATVALLRERGYRELNVDVVAERTGIAKTTIYRRWPSKAALVAAAVGPLRDLGGDAHAIVEETVAVLAMLGTLEGDAMDVVRAIIEPRRAALIASLGDADAADAELGRVVVRAMLGA